MWKGQGAPFQDPAARSWDANRGRFQQGERGTGSPGFNAMTATAATLLLGVVYILGCDFATCTAPRLCWTCEVVAVCQAKLAHSEAQACPRPST
ncbi:hypothetical protein BU23DRAFT_256967 [Bimuria novae-zelandiae CBS 107.79]|uniref:Uncharacterized protein n=1 Tax=Bimuria novae-zelandiae CBS 107.79 TaxID=1447943 RepID=A0A6A5V689_9PLEO|nr:hypothetical protein BU23DRAFT_256967 [Bimuria novae-zelandiae CBS 107.79]